VTRNAWPPHATVWRWHFYAGVLCIPFVLWLAATGSIYLFKPQIDLWLDRPYEGLALSGPPASASAQVSAALAAVPGSVLHSYELPRTSSSAVQVLVGHGADLERAYVHPQTLRVLRVVDEDSRFTNQIFHLHGELMAGDRGSLVVETAASWTIVMLITGLYLWWPSGASGMAGVVYPRMARTGRLFWRDIHAVTGFWVTFFALFLLLSGLPWAKSWGGLLQEVRQWGTSASARQDWTTGRSSELAQRRTALAPPTGAAEGEHVQHHHGDMQGSAAAGLGNYNALDALVRLVRSAGLQPPVLISPPSQANTTWTAKSDTQNRPLRVELTLDSARPAILSRHGFSSKPLLDRVIDTGIAAHEGQLFAPLNQLLGLFTAISLWFVCISAIVMWWRRRPAGLLGAPPPSPDRASWSLGVILVALVLGGIFPMMGGTLLAVWAIEWAVLRRWAAARTFLGLSVPVALSRRS